MEYIILVDKEDNEIGIEEKIKAYIDGSLYRAILVLVFNSSGELLIQKRANSKYHCRGLWSNTVCTYPESNKSLINGAHRRLKQEMGFDCPLKKSI